MKTLTVSGLARALGFSREHVSRHYKGWGFVPVPWASPTRPRFLAEHVAIFNSEGSEGLKRVVTSSDQTATPSMSADDNDRNNRYLARQKQSAHIENDDLI